MKTGVYYLLVLMSLFTRIDCRAADGGKIRILGIGNSFTYNSTHLLNLIMKNGGVEADVGIAIIGGCSLDRHVSVFEAYEADPDDPAGKAYKYILNRKDVKKGASLKEVLLNGPWDYVTIQQVSSKSYLPETYHPYAEKLCAYIEKYAPDAEIVIHETWTHSDACPRVRQWNLPPEEMYEKLHAAYTQLGRDLNLRVIPVGSAFERVRNLPEEQRINLHARDGFHAGMPGEYLGGLVWYEFFFKKDARDITFAPKDVKGEQEKILRNAAHETMVELCGSLNSR